MNGFTGKFMRRQSRKASLFDSRMLLKALEGAVFSLNPVKMMRNPVMFVTEVGAIITSIELIREIVQSDKDIFYTLVITFILWITVLFATFAEALAEVR